MPWKWPKTGHSGRREHGDDRPHRGDLPGRPRALGRRAGDARPGADPQRRREILGGGEARHRRPGAGQDTGEEPEFSPETAHGLRMLESLDEAVREANLQSRYYSRQGSLHGECFYNGLCDPLEDTERRIRETSDYIDTSTTPSA